MRRLVGAERFYAIWISYDSEPSRRVERTLRSGRAAELRGSVHGKLGSMSEVIACSKPDERQGTEAAARGRTGICARYRAPSAAPIAGMHWAMRKIHSPRALPRPSRSFDTASARPRGIGDFPRSLGRCRHLAGMSNRRKVLPARCVFSVVAARTDGARRLRRFRVAQPLVRCEKASVREIAAVKRPEGRAPAQILVGTLNRYPARCRQHLSGAVSPVEGSGSQRTAQKSWRLSKSDRAVEVASMSITPAPCQAREASQTGTRELRMGQAEPSGPITCETMRIRTFNLIFFAAGRCLECDCMRQHQTQQCVEVELRLTCSVDEFKVQSREWSPERNRLLPPTTGSFAWAHVR